MWDILFATRPMRSAESNSDDRSPKAINSKPLWLSEKWMAWSGRLPAESTWNASPMLSVETASVTRHVGGTSGGVSKRSKSVPSPSVWVSGPKLSPIPPVEGDILVHTENRHSVFLPLINENNEMLTHQANK